MKNFTDNKKYWQTVKHLFSDSAGIQNITLVENENIISNDDKIAETFNIFFSNSVKSLDLPENNVLLS